MPKIDTSAMIRNFMGPQLDTAAMVRNFAGPQLDTAAMVRAILGTPIDTSATVRAILGTPIDTSATVRAILGMSAVRNLATSFASVPSADVLGVWREASSVSEDTPSTERVLDQVHVRFPHLSREAVRWLVIAWATAMVHAYTLYLSMEYPKGFDEVWARLGPPVIIASLANNIFVSNSKRPGDKK